MSPFHVADRSGTRTKRRVMPRWALALTFLGWPLGRALLLFTICQAVERVVNKDGKNKDKRKNNEQEDERGLQGP